MATNALFTQSAYILLDRPVPTEALSAALRSFNLLGPKDAAPGPTGWAFGGEGLMLSMEPELRGVILVDHVPRPWPDDLGESDPEGDLFAAWTMGYFGPCTAPGNLERAAQQCWVWDDGSAVADAHTGFLRIRSTCAPPESAAPPAGGHNPLLELLLVTEVARALCGVEGALGYFNPNGETLRSAEAVREGLEVFRDEGMPPLDLWSNVRLLLHAESRWSLMDTVGMAQLGILDHEACFTSNAYEPEEVDRFLRNATYAELMKKADLERIGVAGPGGVPWSALASRATVPPAREVMRWLPNDQRPVPDALLART
jgi:hypothetical protein